MYRRDVSVHEHHLIPVSEKVEGDDDKFNCRACGQEEEITGGQIYYWCTLCKSHFHDKCGKLRLQIEEFFFHPCPLFLRSSPDTFGCYCCFVSRCKAFFYYCKRCLFSICVECFFNMCGECEGGEVLLDVYCGRRILHSCHRHTLQPLSLEPPPTNHNNSSSSSFLSSSSCRVCNTSCSLGPTWGCEPCNFYLHKFCLDFLPRVVEWKYRFETSTMTWVLITIPGKICIDCRQKISSGLVFRLAEYPTKFVCISCCLMRRLRVVNNYSFVPQVINHFSHPYHDLKLILSPPSTCNACFQSCPHHFSYHCSSCDCFLCFDCATSLRLLGNEKHMVQHFCHWHPLELFATSTQDTNNHTCSFCERFCSAPFYRCGRRCQFYIHKSCLDLLPKKSALLRQTLALLTVPHFECTTCKRQLAGLAFYCRDSKCKFCVKCVVWPEGDDGRLSGVPHWHRFILHETRIKDKRRTCFLCKESCIAWTWSYKCTSGCDLFFHKSCLDSPAQLEHPIHPQQCLTFTKRSSSKQDVACKLCLKDLSRNFPLFDWVYQSIKCDFWLDTQCATCLPSLEYQEHPHLLYLVLNMHGDIKCQVCGKSCQGSATIHCGQPGCDFSLHLQCGPLPLMVNHVCHVHPLILKEYYVEDNDSDQFACHICEEERDPRLRVYCCSDGCLMICDVKCVLNEVVPLLRGERGVVELRTPFPQVSCRVISDKSVFAEPRSDSTTIEGAIEEEYETIKHYFSYEKLLSPLEGQLRIESEKDDNEAREEIDVNSYPFTWTALSYFLKLLRIPSLNIHALPLIRQYDGSTTEGEDELPKLLGPIYEEFFTMYNIIDHRSNLSFAEKRALVFITCCVLHQMRTTKVVDVTKDTILVWLGLLRFVQDKGRFNVGFVAENIKHVWQAHYYIQSKKIVDDKTLRLEQEIEQVSMYNAEMRTKLDEIRMKLWEGEARLRELRVMDKEHDTYRVVGSRGPMKNARSDALAIKWRTCYDSLVTFPGNAPAM